MKPANPFDVSDATPFWCARCECMLSERTAEWVDDTPYCKDCYDWLAVYGESQAEAAEESRAEAKGAEV